MQFRATTADIDIDSAQWQHLRDVQCPSCHALYRLWSPFIDAEYSELGIHTDWLSQHLMDTCPTHANDIRTPDPSAEKARSYWLEEARAKAIQEAEDAGLRGPEREAFIREHTDIYYAELLLKRVG
jgi:hypothetical protein